MTQFEYLAIAFSLLYSLAALRIIGGWSSAISSNTRSPGHLALTFIQLFLVATSFWVFFSLSEVAWTFHGFLVALLIPGSLYYCSSVLIPSEPASVESWTEYYNQVRRRWFFGMAMWAVAAAISSTVNLSMELTHPARAVHLTAAGIGAWGASTSSDRVHKGLTGLLLLLVVGTLAAQLRPGWLTVG